MPTLLAESREHRIEVFRDLKFTQKEAVALADAWTVETVRDRAGFIREYESPLSITAVRRALEAGASHPLVLRIFT